METPRIPSCRGSWSVGRHLLLPLGLGAVLAALLWPLDATLSQALQPRHLPGDLRRSLETLQQFGDPTVIILTSLVILSLDPIRRRRLPDWWLAAALAAMTVLLIKLVCGRARPVVEDPYLFQWLWQSGQWTPPKGGPPVVVEAWRLAGRASYAFSSMPSNHTVAATAMGVFLWHTYPPLRALAVALVAVTGLARVMLGAHYPSDVVAGAALAYVVAQPIIAGRALSGRWDRSG